VRINPVFTGTSCGNQFAFLDVQGGMEVWQLSSQSSDEQFALRTHRNFFNLRPSHFALDNETIYLADKNGDVQIWDLRTDLISTWTASDKKIGYIQITQDRIVTCSNKQFLIWNKENKNLLHRVPNGTYKSCILLGNFLYTHQKEHRLDTQSSQVAPWGNDFIYDLVLYRDEIITGSTQGEIKRWNPRTWKQETLAKHGVRIERMYVVGDLLIYQISKDFCVFDLQKKQLLQKTSLGNYHIKAALGGMVIASNKFEFKIFDYRIW
jgi:WD40 repeat protein